MNSVEAETDLGKALERVLSAFVRYYNINRETPRKPFCAEAVFQSHDEQYFLLKSAKLTEYYSSEHIFFAKEDTLTKDRLLQLEDLAWRTGSGRAKPGPLHRNTDVGLFIIANTVTDEAKRLIPTLRHSVSYRFGLHGYSHFRLVAYDLSDRSCVRNRMGDTLEKVIVNIFNNKS